MSLRHMMLCKLHIIKWILRKKNFIQNKKNFNVTFYYSIWENKIRCKLINKLINLCKFDKFLFNFWLFIWISKIHIYTRQCINTKSTSTLTKSTIIVNYEINANKKMTLKYDIMNDNPSNLDAFESRLISLFDINNRLLSYELLKKASFSSTYRIWKKIRFN